MKTGKVTLLNREINRLSNWSNIVYDQRVRKLIDQIIKENEPRVKELMAEREAIVSKRKPPKPRWSEAVPEEVLNFCKIYWQGTTEYNTFRIHCWNDKAVWTSWPNGGYSDNGGWHPTPARFLLISRKEKDMYGKWKELAETTGRTSIKFMHEKLDAL